MLMYYIEDTTDYPHIRALRVTQKSKMCKNTYVNTKHDATSSLTFIKCKKMWQPSIKRDNKLIA